MATLEAPQSPVVLDPIDLVDLIEHVLGQEAQSSTLVVCGTKDDFLKHLASATIRDSDVAKEPNPSTNIASAPSIAQPIKTKAHRWDTATLRLLASARTVSLAFCPDVTHLRAYLATYSTKHPAPVEVHGTGSSPVKACSLLMIIDPIKLHRPTSAFSAQGLNRTFAGAVEAASRTQSRLIIAECSMEPGLEPVDDAMVDDEDRDAATTTPGGNPWDERVSILNISTKTFRAGERGWVGRTVKIRSIAERWCAFEKLPSHYD